MSNEPKSDASTLPDGNGLHSTKSTHRLNQIDRVRANGIGDHISLPQLVVCGDQSSGKSSVLQGITGIPFPRQDGLCTRFATEIILRHSLTTSSITATLIPHTTHSDTEKGEFSAYHRALSSYAELPSVIEDALDLMQLRGSGDPVKTTGPSFSLDILRIEVVGNTGLHLTVVDLPGLISAASDEQTEDDVSLVSSLIDEYLAMERTIALAVVQASNDIANQGIIQRVRKFDPEGKRTVGIITKPDLVNRGTENRIAKLAKNEDTTKLKLGFFLVKNPSPKEIDDADAADDGGFDGISAAEWRRREYAFFFQASPWKEQRLDRDRVGAGSLTTFLQSLLDAHIDRELPKVRREVQDLLSQTRDKIQAMGEERPSIQHLRSFLMGLSMQFMGVTQAALDGNYLEMERKFADEELDVSYRLRAESHKLNGKFSEDLRHHGKKKVFDSADRKQDDDKMDEEAEFNAWITAVYTRTRGRELPGNYNHLLLAELFKEQSSPWERIARDHVEKVNDLVQKFVGKAMKMIVADDKVRSELHQDVGDRLESCLREADDELDRILEDEQRVPMTYNHHYTDNIQQSRQDSMSTSIQKMVKVVISEDWDGSLNVSNEGDDHEKLLKSFEKRVVVNMDEQACQEAKVGLEAYYKVAQKTFVDNVCRQVVERHIMSKLPYIFSPTVVTEFSDEDLVRIASEPEVQKEKRAGLVKLANGLQESLRELRH